MPETERLVLRRWTDDDRAPFAAMNADPEVMEHFVTPLDRAASDAMVDRIEAQFETHGYGLWAVAVRETGDFIGFTGLAVQTYPAPFTPASTRSSRRRRCPTSARSGSCNASA